MPYMVESERHVTGYTHGLILKFGSVGSTDADPDPIGSGSDGSESIYGRSGSGTEISEPAICGSGSGSETSDPAICGSESGSGSVRSTSWKELRSGVK
jgi:hypothetical protein